MSLHPLDLDDDVALWQGNALAALTDLASLAIDSDDPQTVARALHALDGIKDRLVDHTKEVEAQLLACLKGRNISGIVVGRHKFKKAWIGGNRKGWKHAEAWSAVSRAAYERAKAEPVQFDRETGERIDDLTIGVRAGVAAARLAAPSPSWTVGGLKELGYDADEFSTLSGGHEGIEREVAPVDESEPWAP